MALILGRSEVEGLLDLESAMTALEEVMTEEIEGTTFHMPSWGGGSTKRRTFRLVGGGLYGMKRMGVRTQAGVQLFDTDTGRLLAIVGASTGDLRTGATMALAARYLARPDARTIGFLGSGRSAPTILQCLVAVRPIASARVYSPTRAHREAFAERETAALGIPVVAMETAAEAIDGADIVAVATNSRTAVVGYDDVRPGVHVTSMGYTTELAEDLYVRADQFVVPSREQEIEAASPVAHPHIEGTLYLMVRDGRYDPRTMIELGSIIRGDVAPRNGPHDVTVFRDSRGGVGDVALANWVYERARERGLGIEVDL
ncbi:MAG TPA: ornithine cyclodeaminase family protein [Chloroflexota bacterium]|nr:ornithine cyclodeaminase family protein [Chloroflexota bacterium]